MNDVPSFTASPDETSLEDGGPQAAAAWATDLSAGPSNESGQTLTFTVSTDNDALFSVLPTVDGVTGELNYESAPDANGSATLSVYVMDDGGTADGGVDTSATQTVTITITPVNDVPSFTAGPAQTVLEDEGPQMVSAWATALSTGPANEAHQTLTFTVTTDNDSLFSASPTVDGVTGDLSYEGGPDEYGSATLTIYVMDDGGTDNAGVDTSATQTVTITITPVNDVPSFTAGPDQTVLEDEGPQVVSAWATALSTGPANEAHQTLTFTVTTDNDSLFSALPTVDGVTGDLSYQGGPDEYGSATLSVYVMDDGGTADGGADMSATQTVTITITPVNDVPSFTAGPDQTVLEDVGPQVVSAWAIALSTGPPNEAHQTLTFTVTTDNDSLFSTLPFVDGMTGDLSYEVAQHANGSATLTVYVMDDGGTANGGVDTSGTQTVTVSVSPVNDEPSFDGAHGLLGDANQEIWEDAGPQIVPAWATGMSAGPANEAHQTLTFLIVNDNPALFSDLPTIDAVTGELTYTVADHEHGVANLEVRIRDDGGTADGGVDASDPQPLMITINAVNDAPVIGLTDGWVIDSPDLHATGPYDLYGSGMDDLDTYIGDGVEAMDMVMEVGLFAEHGVLSLPNAVGVTFLVGDGVDDRIVKFEGEQADLNAALSHLEYRPDQFFGGFDRVLGYVDDRGWYGDGGPLGDDDISILEVKVPLGSATEFDVFGIGDVELLRSSAHGRIAAGEALRLHMFQAADVPFGAEQDVLISGGSITASLGSVYNGNAVYWTTADIDQTVGFFNSANEPRQEFGVVDFAHAEGDLEYRSASWGLAAPTGTTELFNDILHLSGAGRDLNVFSIDRADLEAASTVQLSTPPGAFALLNINGGAVEHSHFGVLISGVDERSVLMNFYEAESMVLYGTELAGSVLAPNAHVTVDALTVGGNLVADSVELVDGSAEGNRLAGEPWENTPWIMMMADEDGEDQHGYTLTFEPSGAEQDVTFQLTDAGELEVLADAYPTIRYQTDRITRLVVLDREGMSHLQISDKIELPYELAGNGPVAYDDSASLDGKQSVLVDVLSNDLAGPAPLDLSSVKIVTQPQYGTVKIDSATGAVTYQQGRVQPGVLSSDEFWYTVRDELSNTSTARRVRVY